MKPRKPKRVCGARNRRGTPCQCKKLLKGRRCIFHGGKSTGPRSETGKAASLKAALRNLRLAPNWRKHAGSQ